MIRKVKLSEFSLKTRKMIELCYYPKSSYYIAYVNAPTKVVSIWFDSPSHWLVRKLIKDKDARTRTGERELYALALKEKLPLWVVLNPPESFEPKLDFLGKLKNPQFRNLKEWYEHQRKSFQLSEETIKKWKDYLALGDYILCKVVKD